MTLDELQLFEHAIDWPNVTYRLYNYGPQGAQVAYEVLGLYATADRRRRAFLDASWTQVLVPLREDTRLEQILVAYFKTGTVDFEADLLGELTGSEEERYDELTAIYRDLILQRASLPEEPPKHRRERIPTDIIVIHEPTEDAPFPVSDALILIFSIFPLVASLILAFARVRLRAGGYNVRFVGFKNFEKQFFGSEQYHFLGKFTEISLMGWALILVAGAGILWWLYKFCTTRFNLLGFVGRSITASMAFGLVLILAATLLSGNRFGTLGVTLFYVFVGCAIQFGIGLGLALLCSQQIRGKTFFRVVFFIPLMITPIGIGYAFRMLADTTKGPFSPVWQWVGLGEYSWATSAWAART